MPIVARTPLPLEAPTASVLCKGVPTVATPASRIRTTHVTKTAPITAPTLVAAEVAEVVEVAEAVEAVEVVPLLVALAAEMFRMFAKYTPISYQIK